MTTGEKIAAKRRSMGLSQEALGEMLGVSRQAIYKWESDNALPEIDKLIVLSRTFGTSVGWILGEEEDEQPKNDASGLNEEQLKSIAEIVEKYTSELKAPKKEKRHIFLYIAVLCLTAGVIILGVSLANKIDIMQNKVTFFQNSINADVNSIADRVDEAIRKVSDILIESEVYVTDTDIPDNKVYFSLYAVPKTFTGSMKTVFRIACDGKVTEIPCKSDDGYSFTAEAECPLCNEIEISVSFDTDGVKTSAVLDTFYDLYSDSMPSATVNTNTTRIDSDGLMYAGTVDVTVNSGFFAFKESEDVKVKSVKCGLFRNGVLVKWYECTDRNDDTYVFARPQTTLDKTGKFVEACVVTDEYGREAVYASDSVHKYSSELNGFNAGSVYGIIEQLINKESVTWVY